MLWSIFFFSPYWIVYLSYVIEFLSSVFLHLNFYIVIMLFLFILSYLTGSTLSKPSACPSVRIDNQFWTPFTSPGIYQYSSQGTWCCVFFQLVCYMRGEGVGFNHGNGQLLLVDHASGIFDNLTIRNLALAFILLFKCLFLKEQCIIQGSIRKAQTLGYIFRIWPVVIGLAVSARLFSSHLMLQFSVFRVNSEEGKINGKLVRSTAKESSKA